MILNIDCNNIIESKYLLECKIIIIILKNIVCNLIIFN